jgi:hypothetical protein
VSLMRRCSCQFGLLGPLGSHGTQPGGRCKNHWSRADMIELAIGVEVWYWVKWFRRRVQALVWAVLCCLLGHWRM